MNVTHDQILALLVLKDQKILQLETDLALANATVAGHKATIDELLAKEQESCPPQPSPEKSATPSPRQ